MVEGSGPIAVPSTCRQYGRRAGLLNNLANRLSDLGHREAALKAAQEAVALYRTQADARPDAFTPDLAMTLGAISQILIKQDRQAEAERTLHGAITLLSPLFLNSLTTFSNLMGKLCQDCLETCEALEHEPDKALLDPINAAF